MEGRNFFGIPPVCGASGQIQGDENNNEGSRNQQYMSSFPSATTSSDINGNTSTLLPLTPPCLLSMRAGGTEMAKETPSHVPTDSEGSEGSEESGDEKLFFEGHEVIDGYVNLPYYGWVMHPSAQTANRGWVRHPGSQNTEQPLCEYKGGCTHDNQCREIRRQMAVHVYQRTKLPMRRVAKLWGVPRAIISRRKRELEHDEEEYDKSPLALILNL